MKVIFKVVGDPMGKQRPKFSRQGKFVRAYTPNETIRYEHWVRLCWQEAAEELRFEGADTQLFAEINAYFDVPKSVSKKKKQMMFDGEIRPTKKPDVDNIMKVILDSLNKIAFHDDAQFVDVHINKWYIRNEEESPFVEVKLWSKDE